MPKVPKVTISQNFCKIRKKEGWDGIDFLHADKHQTFLQVDAINNFAGQG